MMAAVRRRSSLFERDSTERRDQDFDRIAAPLVAIAGPAYPVQAVIRVTVRKVTQIVAPSLWMHPGVDALQRRRGALRAYGVVDL